MRAEPTGRYRYRATRRGELVLQIEELVPTTELVGGMVVSNEYLRWRDARLEDFPLCDSGRPRRAAGSWGPPHP